MYKAFVAKIDKVEPIEKAETIQKAFVLGSQVIVSKEKKEGDVVLFFPEEGVLSDDFLKENNLYRHSNLNKDKNKKGYFDDNGRIRTQKFLGEKSEGFVAELNALNYLGKINDLQVGDEIQTINGVVVAKKYINSKTLEAAQRNKNKKKKFRAIFTEMFPQHFDTEQFRFYKDKIKKGSLITISSKIHGTSGRYGCVKVKHNLPKWKATLNKVFRLSKTEEWQYLVGTRRVDLYEEENAKESYHGSEQFRFDILEYLKPYLEKNMVIYGEIVGWANGKPLMPPHDISKLKDKDYTKKYGREILYKYNNRVGENSFVVYRIAYVNEDGKATDLSPFQAQAWCEKRGLKFVKTVFPSFIYDGDVKKLERIVEDLTERPQVLTEDYNDPSHISEGVVVRVDGPDGVDFFKNKSFAFKVMESIIKESDFDLEDAS